MKGGGLWYFHTYIGMSQFFRFENLNLTNFGGFQKYDFFFFFFFFFGGGGYEDFVDIF